MGLDTSHDCFHGGYGTFHQWRQLICELAGYGNMHTYKGCGGTKPWPSKKKHPLVILLAHSDCDGVIKAKDCGHIVMALQKILPKLDKPEDRMYLEFTKSWIDGLIDAAMRHEDVDFH